MTFARLATALNLKGISHHVLRHTGATVMVAAGVSLRAVQTISGWSSLRMVERYAHVDDAELARAVRITQQHTEAATPFSGRRLLIHRPRRLQADVARVF